MTLSSKFPVALFALTIGLAVVSTPSRADAQVITPGRLHRNLLTE